jgi:hypothetical protein
MLAAGARVTERMIEVAADEVAVLLEEAVRRTGEASAAVLEALLELDD